MSRSFYTYLVATTLLSGCNSTLQLNLVVYDPCDSDQSPLSDSEHIELDVFSAAEGEHSNQIWSAADGGGQLEGIPTFEEAVVSVIGRSSTGSGSPGLAVAAGSVGNIDLSGQDGSGLVELDIAIGRVGEFMSTTDVSDSLSCTRLDGERSGHTATLLPDGRVLVVGGIAPAPGGDPLDASWWRTSELFDPKSGAFVPGPEVSPGRRGHSATRLDDGQVLIAGGEGLLGGDGEPLSNQPLFVSQLFDGATDTLGEKFPLPEQRAFHSATLLGDGRVLLAGGLGSSDDVLDSTTIFDPSRALSGAFSPGPSLNGIGRMHHAAVRIGRLQVALIGGQGPGGPVAPVQFIDVGTNETIDGPDLEIPRTYVAASLLPDSSSYLVVVGGFATAVVSPELGVGVDTVELIQLDTSSLDRSDIIPCQDPLSGARLMSLAEPRGAPGIAEVEGGLLVVGGVDDNGDVSNTAEIFSISDVSGCLDVSVPARGPLAVGRGGAQVTPLVGGDLLVTGGFGFSGGEAVAVGEGEIYVQFRQ